MTLSEYVAIRKAEIDQFFEYNTTQTAKYGTDWLPETMTPGGWREQEDAWLQLKLGE